MTLPGKTVLGANVIPAPLSSFSVRVLLADDSNTVLSFIH